MNHSHLLLASLLAAGLTSPVAAQQPTPVPLNYNFNGVIHAGEAGLPDDAAGFRSISDRALDFSAGVPSDALLDNYQLVSAPGVFDIVHLGNRNTVDNGNWAFDAVADADNIGTQPAWLANPDQSGPQVSAIAPMFVSGNTVAMFIYQISNGGGSFDVTFDLAIAGTYTATLSGPDWFNGAYAGTQDVDQANPGNNLSITEGRIDLGQFEGDVVTAITFSNASNPVAGYAILACSFENAAKHTQVGLGCYTIDERAGWHQELANSAVAEATLENETLLLAPNGSGYTTIVATGTGTLLPGNPASPLTLTDDSQVAVTLPAAFNYRGTTPVSTVYVCSNGFLSMGPGNSAIWTAVETTNLFTTLADPAIVAYGEDLNPGAGGSVTTEYDAVGGIFYITFEAVPHFNNSGAVTFQYQLELASGVCTIVYGDVTPEAGNDAVLIGESVPAATTANPIDIFAAVSTDTYAVETIQPGVTLSADVPAVSTATSGTPVIYSVTSAPDFSPSVLPGAKVGVLIGSFNPLFTAGLDLGFLNAPGCPAYLTSIDWVDAFDLGGNYLIPYPAGIQPQTRLNFQAAMLFDDTDPLYATTPAGLNGNTFTQTSNALTTVIADY